MSYANIAETPQPYLGTCEGIAKYVAGIGCLYWKSKRMALCKSIHVIIIHIWRLQLLALADPKGGHSRPNISVVISRCASRADRRVGSLLGHMWQYSDGSRNKCVL